MASLNKVFLMGNLTFDPDLRVTPGGSSICRLGMAVNRQYTNRNGEKIEETDFINIDVWGKQGENCANYLKKGRPVFVEGRLRARSYETKDGQKRNVLEVVAERVQFLGPRQDSGQGQAPKPDMPPPIDRSDLDDVPF